MQAPIFDSCVLLINTGKKKKVVSFARTIEILEHDQRFDSHMMSDQNKEIKHVTFNEWAEIFHFKEISAVKKTKYGWNKKLWKTCTANKILSKIYKISP